MPFFTNNGSKTQPSQPSTISGAPRLYEQVQDKQVPFKQPVSAPAVKENTWADITRGMSGADATMMGINSGASQVAQGNIGAGIAQGAGTAIGASVGGPVGAAVGNIAGKLVGGLFGGDDKPQQQLQTFGVNNQKNSAMLKGMLGV